MSTTNLVDVPPDTQTKGKGKGKKTWKCKYGCSNKSWAYNVRAHFTCDKLICSAAGIAPCSPQKCPPKVKNLFVKEHAEKLTKAQNKVGHEGNVEEARKVQEKQKAEDQAHKVSPGKSQQKMRMEFCPTMEVDNAVADFFVGETSRTIFSCVVTLPLFI